MDDRTNMRLDEILAVIFEQMEASGYSPQTIVSYKRVMKRLQKLAFRLGKEDYDQELAQAFLADSSYARKEGYCHSRYLFHVRCIQFIESFIKDGVVDWSVPQRLPRKRLDTLEFNRILDRIVVEMERDGLKPNTIEGYLRLDFYFLKYLEDKGYHSLSEVQPGDILLFMSLVCQEHYSATSIGAHLPGLRRFILAFPELRAFESEIPERVPKNETIIEVYTDEEYEQICACLRKSRLSNRDKSIALVAIETGLRAVDICSLKLSDIDWAHDVIRLTQQKTGKGLTIPMRPALGNALMSYLLEERPVSDSEYVFLSFAAPHHPLESHAGIYNVLRKLVSEAGITPDGRISGTRMTRHSYASRMLRKGVPLPLIAEALGHSGPGSTMRYLTTDDKMLASCALPLPKGGAL